ATACPATRAADRVAVAAAAAARPASSAAPARTRIAPRDLTGIQAMHRCSRPTTPIRAATPTGVRTARGRAATARTARAGRARTVPAPGAAAARVAIAAATAKRTHASETGPLDAAPRHLPGDASAGIGPGG